MSDVEPARTLLVDSFQRIRDLVVDLTDDLPDDIAFYRPDRESNTISWLIWHLIRIQDDHLADLAGTTQVWAGAYEQFDLPFGPEATGYGQSAADVAAVRIDGERLGRYHADVHRATLDYLDGITTEELDRVVDDRWDPPVTAGVRLVSVIGDALQHLGQAAYLRGLAERRSAAWHDPHAAEH